MQIECLVSVLLNYIPSTLSLFVYAVVLVACYRLKNELSPSFTAIVISAGVADIWYMAFLLFQIWYPELLVYELWIEKGGQMLATAVKVQLWYMYLTQTTGVALITLNRLVAIVRPLQYKKFWSTPVTSSFIVFQWLWPIPVVLPMLTSYNYGSVYRTLNQTTPTSIGWLFPKFVDNNTDKIYTTVNNVVDFGFFLPFFVISYAVIYLQIFRQGGCNFSCCCSGDTPPTTVAESTTLGTVSGSNISNTQPSVSTTAVARSLASPRLALSRTASKLAFIGLCTVLSYTLVICFNHIIFHGKPVIQTGLSRQQLIIVYRLATSLFGLITAYMLLAVSPKVRHRALEICWLRQRRSARAPRAAMPNAVIMLNTTSNRQSTGSQL